MEKPRKLNSKKHNAQKLGVNIYSRVNDTITIIYGSKNAVRKGVEFMDNVKKKMDLCFDNNAPSIVIDVADYKNGYNNIRKRGGKIRVITEINNENMKYCKELMNIVDEMKHLDNIKGGIAINDDEYMATNILHESKPLTQVVYSNVVDVVEQQQNFFNSLWKVAIPAKQKIREITLTIEQNHVDVFSALDNKIRRQVILNLSEKSMTMSQISKKLNISLQAFQKHFSKLVNSNLVEKNFDGSISLTNVGRIIVKQIPSIQFISENSERLKTYDLTILPTHLLERIGEISEFETILEKSKDEKYVRVIEESKKQINVILPQNFNTVLTIQKILKKKVNTRCITDCHVDYHKDRKYEKLEKNCDKYTYFEKKNIDEIPLMLVVSERSAFLAFKKNDGVLELKNSMYSKDETFLVWCNDFFDHMWKNSR